ncbi:MAG TPA: N-acetylneuraminate synthase family protein [Gemmatimonadaceae bacterium]|nr:N-acetylneuraminate synthase family protein [Gemmatimonadaceae bacterium]
MPEIRLGTATIDESSQPYVIAEIGVNHEGSLELAKRLIDLAKEGGADAAKFQTYKAERLASKHSPAYWDLSKEPTTSQLRLFKKYDAFGPADYEELAGHCSKVGIDFVSTPFDEDAVEFLSPLMPFFKIASADLTNTPLLRQVARHDKPVVLSTGASTTEEISDAVRTLRNAGCSELSLLHCVLNYPTADENANLGMITALSRQYPELVIGYSDHTVPDEGMTVLCSAWLMGARILEKHFTHDKSLPGNDHYHAMDAQDLARFRRYSERLRLLVGDSSSKHAIETEEISRLNARRSIVIDAPVASGDTITESMLTYKRPGTGVSPVHWDEVIGRRAARDLDRDHVLQWADLAPAD